MAKYTYPAIFHKDKETSGYWIEFPDWNKVGAGAYTDGKNYAQARYMAEDLLNLFCWEFELDCKKMPPASNVIDFIVKSPNFVELIDADTEEYAKMIRRCRKDRRRWRMEERAREKFLYKQLTFTTHR